MTGRRARIDAAFSAARDYDRHARVQARVAESLAGAIRALPLGEAPAVLEIGCGTGHLTQALARLESGALLATDLSPAMVDRARARVSETPGRRFAVLDGEYGPQPDGDGFDLICSSLAFQWFDDPAAAAQRLSTWLRPGGWLAFTTLTQGTFAEWRAAHERVGQSAGTLSFPAAAALAVPLPAATCTVERLTERHSSATDFVHALKAIGAGTPVSGHRPLSPAALRAVLRAFESAGATATYEVATILWQKPRP